MLRIPTHSVTEPARRNLDRFRATSAASELDDDKRVWAAVEWSWTEGPPLRVQLRSDSGELVEFLMDETGCWRLRKSGRL